MVGVVAMKITVGLCCWKETSSGLLWLDWSLPEQPWSRQNRATMTTVGGITQVIANWLAAPMTAMANRAETGVAAVSGGMVPMWEWWRQQHWFPFRLSSLCSWSHPLLGSLATAVATKKSRLMAVSQAADPLTPDSFRHLKEKQANKLSLWQRSHIKFHSLVHFIQQHITPNWCPEGRMASPDLYLP